MLNIDWSSTKQLLKRMKDIATDSVVDRRAEGPSGFSTPRLRGVPSLLLLEFSFLEMRRWSRRRWL